MKHTHTTDFKNGKWIDVPLTKLKLILKIVDRVCPDCGEDSDCGYILEDCPNIQNALDYLDEFLKELSNASSNQNHRLCTK